MNLITVIKNFIILSFFLAFFHALPAEAQTTYKLYAFVSDMSGDVEILKSDTQEWVPANTESIISEGDQVRTGPFSNASLAFADSSFAIVDSFSHLTVNKFSVTDNVVDTNIFLDVGSVVSTLNDNVSFVNRYIIGTPTSSISLKGREIKKIVAGAMYKDTVRADNRKEINIDVQATGTTTSEKESDENILAATN